MTKSRRSVDSTKPASDSTSAPNAAALTRLMQVASWAPLPAGCAFVAAVLLQWASITSALIWDADAAAAPLIADQFGRPGTGAITIAHFGWYSMLWLMAGTRDIPGHQEFWQVMPYALVIAGLSALGLVIRHFRGPWAGAIFLAASVAIGPFALRSLVTPNYHTTTVINVALLGAALPLLNSGSGKYMRRATVAVPIALLTGLDVASDPLLWVVGVIPFMVAVVYCAIRFRNVRVPMLLVAIMTIVVVAAVDRLVREAMAARGISIISQPVALASLDHLPQNLATLADEVAVVFGADLFAGTSYEGSTLRNIVLAKVILVVFTVLAALLIRELLTGRLTRRGLADQVLTVYAGATILAISGAFALTTIGETSGVGGANYFLALAVTIPLLAAVIPHSLTDRFVIGCALATMMAFNVAGVESGYTSIRAGSVETYAPQIVSTLEREHVRYGYASYWDAMPLTLYSRGSLQVASVSQCQAPAATLCAFQLNSAAAWYRARPGSPSFVIVDPETLFVTVGPPGSGPWRKIIPFGPIEVYISSGDVAPQILYRPS
jgi:hypothetical protein